jgi:acetylornithine deacetylase/succinyl-diaminopimelate desuccinylase-like protein
LVLTCGEETLGAFNSLQWLVQNRPGLVAAQFALNEGGGGLLDNHGRLVEQDLVLAEKTTRNYRLETINPGGHSSLPVHDNAIYELADALVKVRAYEFPIKVTRRAAPLDPRIVRPAERLVEKYFPGVPLVPVMATGSSDGPYLQAIGIPVYGVPGVWADADFNGVHGLNEYISARSLFVGRDLMTGLVKVYANLY